MFLNIFKNKIFNCLRILKFVKDELSKFGNIPRSCKCSICLAEFYDKDTVINLECYHYFHKYCLVRHVIFMKKDIDREKAEALANKIRWNKREVICPVCRMPINEKLLSNLGDLDKCPPIAESGQEELIVISEKMRRIQIEMKNLLEKQRQAGGIIDLSVKDEIIVLSVRNKYALRECF